MFVDTAKRISQASCRRTKRGKYDKEQIFKYIAL